MSFATVVQCGTLIWWPFPGFHAFPDCLRRGRVQSEKHSTPLSLLVSQWDGCRPSMWSGSPFFFNAFIVTSTRWLHLWEVQETELWSVEVKEIWRRKNKLGVCTLRWCSPGCKRWAPSPWARRHACVPCCLRQVWAHYPGRLGTELGEAVRCSRPQILPEMWK